MYNIENYDFLNYETNKTIKKEIKDGNIYFKIFSNPLKKKYFYLIRFKR